jgi:DNA (cytosine-5)-methyltransferase 1
MRYLSVCSGVEAASVAWEPLGWTPVGFSEIEPFPSAVLAHRFPQVKNYGDLTRYKEWDIEPGSVDLLVGGTPCQSFSVAGLRKGLEDPRGNLALTFLALADHLKVKWLLWENVPGVLSSGGGRDFGSFLGALGELGFKWAYRTLDAQSVGGCSLHGDPRGRGPVPQRRRRVFVVAHLGDGANPAEVLFESESLRGDTAKGDEARGHAPRGAGARAAGGGDFGRVAQTLNSRDYKGPSCGRDGIVGNPIVVTATDPATGLTREVVRKLTPCEYEQLQGFPKGWTDIPWRRKPTAPDGLRYKTMAVPVMRRIGERIATVSALAVNADEQ